MVKICYNVRSNHSLTEAKMLNMNGNEFAVAYMPYTGHYYIFNPQTGKEVATITKEFYINLMPFVTGEFIKDPTCKQ